MAALLGIGMTHAPMFQFPDEHMADILRTWLAKNPALRDPRGWPEPMRREWADDEGLAAARAHRAAMIESFRRIRQAIDAFAPDFVLIWGDDQYENFKEDVVPPFCVYLYDTLECMPFANSSVMRATRNVWSVPPDTRVSVRGHREGASRLVRELLEADFDVAFSYKPHHHPTLAHAFMRTLVYLDYDRRGFDYPLVPFHVNCYGADLARHMEGVTGVPPAPTPRRCYDLGRKIAEILGRSDYRVVLIGSSSWSHAFLTAKHDGLYPDVASDRKRFAELAAGRQHEWRGLALDTLVDAGQHELLNWICLAGAMEGRTPGYCEMFESHIFNSNKVSAIFRAE